MKTIKSFTSLKQSKVLDEILPNESADMHYHYYIDFDELESIPTITEEDDHFILFPKDVRCWSLAALLNVLPYTIKLSNDIIDAAGNPAYKNECYKFSINRCGLFGDKWNTQYYGKHQRQLGKRNKELYIDLFLSENYDNLIDACYEMILKLHEEEML